ncbi:MAG: MYG1 family protein [Ruthenibacterium sp.]
MLQVPDTAFTHAGRFHADEVFSTALLQIINPRLTVRRGFRVPEDFSGIVYDIGDGPFDHHAKGSPVRENGIPYAAFGLLWREVGASLVGAEQAARVDQHFIQPLDADDNTGCGNQLAQLIGAYNPAWDSEEQPDECFAAAVAVAKDLLGHKLESLRSIARAADEVNAALAKRKDGIVRLARYAPWKQQLIPAKDALFVVYPSQRGGWCAQGVPASFGSPALKAPFPAAWAGLDESSLRAISNIEGLRFCHAGRFLVTTATEEDALAACRAALAGEDSEA